MYDFAVSEMPLLFILMSLCHETAATEKIIDDLKSKVSVYSSKCKFVAHVRGFSQGTSSDETKLTSVAVRFNPFLTFPDTCDCGIPSSINQSHWTVIMIAIEFHHSRQARGETDCQEQGHSSNASGLDQDEVLVAALPMCALTKIFLV